MRICRYGNKNHTHTYTKQTGSFSATFLNKQAGFQSSPAPAMSKKKRLSDHITISLSNLSNNGVCRNSPADFLHAEPQANMGLLSLTCRSGRGIFQQDSLAPLFLGSKPFVLRIPFLQRLVQGSCQV